MIEAIIGTLLGTILGGALGFASAHLHQRQRFKREDVIEMRKKIYGPLFMEISNIVDSIDEDYFRPDLGNLDSIKCEYRFPAIKQDLKNGFSAIKERVQVYDKIRLAAELTFNEKSSDEIKKKFKIDDPGDPPRPYLELRLEEAYIGTLSLKEAVFQQISPSDFLNEEKAMNPASFQ